MAEERVKRERTRLGTYAFNSGLVLLGMLIATGIIWPYTYFVLGHKDYELKMMTIANEVRADMAMVYEDIIRLSDQIIKTSRDGRSPSEMIELNRQLDLLKSEVVTLESKLAAVERREPRTISLDFIPPDRQM